MVILGIIQFIISIIVCLYEFKNKSIAIILCGTLFLMFSLPHFLDIILDINFYSNYVMNISSIFVILFLILYIFTRKIFRIKKNNILNTDEKNIFISGKEISYSLFFIVTGFLFFISYIIINFGGVLGTSWQLLHEQNRTSSIYKNIDYIYILYYFSSYIITAFDGIIVYLLLKKRYKNVFILIFINIVWIMISRTRTNILPMFTSILFFIYIKNKKKFYSLMMKIIIFSLIGLVIVYVLQEIRLAGSLNDILYNRRYVEVFNSGLLSIRSKNSGGELGLRDAFYYFISRDNKFYGFGEMRSYISLFLLPFPQSFTFGIKPDDFAITMGQAYSGNYHINYFSMHPTLFGDCYANMGFLGFILGVFWGMVVNILEKKINETKYDLDKILYSVSISVSMFLIARGAVYYGTRYGFISVCLIWLARKTIYNIKIFKYKIVFRRK